MNLRRCTVLLHSSDILAIAFFAILSIINIIFAPVVPNWWLLILINCLATAFICLLGQARAKTGWKFIRDIHEWYVAPLVFFSFKELYYMIKPIHGGRDYDDVLILILRMRRSVPCYAF